MKKFVFLISIIFFLFACKKEKTSPSNELLNQYTGNWDLSESYYQTGPNGTFDNNHYHLSAIQSAESENEIIIPTSQKTYKFQVDENGVLSGLTDNYTEQELLYNDFYSIETYFVGTDSLYMSWRVSPLNGAGYIEIEITGKKIP